MSFLSKMLKQLKRDIEPKECLVCVRPMSYTDALGLPWCAEHEHHGQVLTWGCQHNFPELHFGDYALGPGDECWWLAIMGSCETGSNRGDEGFMWTALAYVEYLDSQEQEKVSCNGQRKPLLSEWKQIRNYSRFMRSILLLKF